MKYKKITFACVLLGLSLYAGVCAATVREVADEAPASRQTIIADKKDKKLLNKKQRAVQITQEKDKIVVSTKPVAKPPAGTIKVPAAPRPSLLQEKDGKFYFPVLSCRMIIVISLFTVRRLPARRRLLPIFWRLTRL